MLRNHVQVPMFTTLVHGFTFIQSPRPVEMHHHDDASANIQPDSSPQLQLSGGGGGGGGLFGWGSGIMRKMMEKTKVSTCMFIFNIFYEKHK